VQPLVLLFEDLHWIDAETQGFLDGLVESLPTAPILLAVNYRPEYRHDWGGKSYYGQIRLDPLAAAPAEALLETLLGSDRELAQLTSLLIARTEGNPFFLEESVRALAETGVLAGERGAYRLVKAAQPVQIPATVQALLAARIDRLPPADKDLLQSASVIGTTVPLPLLQAIADRSGDDLGARLAQLQSAEFIYETRLFPEAEYEFKHALTQEVAYTGLLHERRRALHGQVVAAIERLYPSGLAEHRDRLVYHAFRGEAWTKAVGYLRDFDQVATPEEIEGAMGMGPESAGQLWWNGEHERALRAAERDLTIAASFRNFGLRVLGSCRLGQAHHALGNYGRAAELFRDVVASTQGGLAYERFGMAAFPSVWARSWLAWALAEIGEFDEATRVADEATAIAAAGDHVSSRIQACWGLGTLYLIQGRLDRAVPALEQGLVSARLENIPFFVPFITAPLGGAYALSGRIDSGIALLEQSVEQAASIRLVAHHSLRIAWLAWAHLLAGRREEALTHARRALDIAMDRQERGQQARVRRLLADVEAGADAPDVPRAEAAYREALELAESLQMRPIAAQCLLGLGGLLRRAGQTEQARAELDDALARFRAMGMTLWIERTRSEIAAIG